MPEKPKAAATGTRFDPKAAKAAAEARRKADAMPGFHLSPKVIVLCCLFAIVPLGVLFFKLGPAKAADQWNQTKPLVDNYATDLVLTVCRDEDPIKTYDEFHRAPSIKALTIDEPPMMLWMPDEIHFDGFSTAGYFRGIYYVKTKTLVTDVGVDSDYRTLHVESHVDAKGHPVIDSKK